MLGVIIFIFFSLDLVLLSKIILKVIKESIWIVRVLVFLMIVVIMPGFHLLVINEKVIVDFLYFKESEYFQEIKIVSAMLIFYSIYLLSKKSDIDIK